MNIEQAHLFLTTERSDDNSFTTRLSFDAGKFFAPPSKAISLGVGKIYSGIRYPIYNEDKQIFQTVQGLVYVLTHECDIDQNNIRPFNTEVLICPILDFRLFVKHFQTVHSEEQLKNFLLNLAQRKVSRVIYIPEYAPDLPYGGLLYFNQITNTHISAFSLDNVKEVCTVTRYGLEIIDQSIENHFLRPKAENLPLLRY
jgi:hypothetical protein